MIQNGRCNEAASFISVYSYTLIKLFIEGSCYFLLKVIKADYAFIALNAYNQTYNSTLKM